MRVRDFIRRRSSKSLDINLNGVYAVKKKYLSMYRAYMVMMYDEGFISDPTCYNEREIRRNVTDLRISGLIRNSGQIYLDSHQAGFALCIQRSLGTEDESVRFLYLLQKVLYYREQCNGIDKFYDTNSRVKGKCALGLTTSGPKIFIKKPYPMCEAVLECFFRSEVDIGKRVEKATFYDKIFNIALIELGLSGRKDDGLFIRGLTREEEIQYCDLILDGLVKITGSEGSRLESWLLEHAWNVNVDDRYKFIKTGLFSYIESQKVDFMFNSQEDIYERISESYGESNILCMGTDSIYYTVRVDYIDLPVSSFVVFAGDEDVVSCEDRNALGGYTGEVYPVEYFSPDGENGFFVGCPFEVWKPSSNEKVLVVDMEQTSYYKKDGSGYPSWFSYEKEVSITFSESVYQEGIFEEGSLEDTLFRVYGDAEAGNILGKVKIESFAGNIQMLEKAKEKVYKGVIHDGKIKQRYSGISMILSLIHI